MLKPTYREDDGFTLIELVMTIAIMAIIMTALVGMVFLYMRTTNETNNKLTESTDQQFASAYWQQDVSSLGIHGVPVGAGNPVPTSQSVWIYPTPSPASGSLPGACAAKANAIAAFAWNDYQSVPSSNPSLAWSGTLNAAVYYTKTVTNSNGTSQIQLWRLRCGDQSTDTLLARYLDPSKPPFAGCYASSGSTVGCSATSPFPATITLTITVRNFRASEHTSTGYKTILTAERRQG